MSLLIVVYHQEVMSHGKCQKISTHFQAQNTESRIIQGVLSSLILPKHRPDWLTSRQSYWRLSSSLHSSTKAKRKPDWEAIKPSKAACCFCPQLKASTFKIQEKTRLLCLSSNIIYLKCSKYFTCFMCFMHVMHFVYFLYFMCLMGCLHGMYFMCFEFQYLLMYFMCFMCFVHVTYFISFMYLICFMRVMEFM